MTDSSNKRKAEINDSNDSDNNKEKPLFKIELSGSIIVSQRFYYKAIEINSLVVEELNNLKKDLDYILNETEKEIDKLLI